MKELWKLYKCFEVSSMQPTPGTEGNFSNRWVTPEMPTQAATGQYHGKDRRQNL